jgi:hypothetical protein
VLAYRLLTPHRLRPKGPIWQSVHAEVDWLATRDDRVPLASSSHGICPGTSEYKQITTRRAVFYAQPTRSASKSTLASYTLLNNLLLHKQPTIISASKEHVVCATSQSQIVHASLSPARIGNAVMMHL